MKRTSKKTEQVLLKPSMLVADHWDSLRHVELARHLNDAKAVQVWLDSGQVFETDKPIIVLVKAPLTKLGFVDVKFEEDGQQWCVLRSSLDVSDD